TTSAKDDGHSRAASTDGSTIDASYTPSIVESRRGTYSDSGTLPVGMVHEGTPIIEESGGLSEKIVEKKSLNGGMEKQAFNLDDVSKWKSMRMGMRNMSRPIMQKHNLLPEEPSKGDKIKYAFSCPPHGKVGQALTLLLLLFLFWGSLVYMTGKHALPGGTIFSLGVLVIVAQLGGMLVAKVRLPPLLGMLLVGIMFRS
ncbi:UNVERIFIED_CONTAM: hypothetical protein GTU68_064675, partial [Idotea baltica]|nr:hypothetical protein [Idotea baltica]